MKTATRLIALVCILGAIACPAMAEMKVGIGYQGVLPADILSGASARVWIDRLGADVNVFQGTADLAGQDASAMLLEVRGLFALFEMQQSKFFVGGTFGVGTAEAGNNDSDLLTFGGFFGSEFSLSGLQEIGFSWEVGYNFVSADTSNTDMDASGILVLFGVHYYPDVLNM